MADETDINEDASSSERGRLDLSRRRVIGGLGSLAVAGAAAGTGLTQLSGVATAASLQISGTSLSVDDGDITQVSVSLSHTAQWQNFDLPVDAVAYHDRIQRLDGSGNVTDEHTLYDNRDSPVLLKNWSSQGNGSDGWGGPDEYTSGPGTTGSVHAGINWTVLAEEPSSAAKSVESPGDIDGYNMDNDTDGSTKTTKLRYVKDVYLYTTESNGGASTTAANGTTVYKMGVDDGTRSMIGASDSFKVDVHNQEASVGSSGSGSSSAQ